MLPLDGNELLHMPTLPEHMHKASLVILGNVDGEQFTDPESGPSEGRDERMVPEPLIRPPRFPHTHRLCGGEQPELLNAAQALPLRLLLLGRLDAAGNSL